MSAVTFSTGTGGTLAGGAGTLTHTHNIYTQHNIGMLVPTVLWSCTTSFLLLCPVLIPARCVYFLAELLLLQELESI